ncbi:dolichyldiphosphatase 1-like [Paramacrobiotus metropolitanus]|uniref:dolichyldiphosphatase 1-like n=1 Tax=Paramacrobiotus metropolitanus TaxID=2943436 RepID=UPI002445E05F|nr:dolichyldiphosphatase 1-like [Paramacrobiotus metropolitanus]
MDIENVEEQLTHKETSRAGDLANEQRCDPAAHVWPLRTFGDPVWVPFTYTFVEHVKGDSFGMLMAIASLLPVFIVVGFATLILFRRDLHTIVFFIGMLLNEGVNWICKHGLGHLRPCTNRVHHGSIYAMPSNHSQFMWFFFAYFTFFLLFRLQKSNPTPQQLQLGNWLWKSVVISASLAASCVVAYSRAYLHYHSSSQVILGCVLGSALGIGWFLVVQNVLTPLFPVVASWKICEILLIRDTTLIPNILFFEYSKQREETSIRMRKLRTGNRNH